MTNLTNIKWKLYWKGHNILFNYGVRKGLIKLYDKEFIESLRNVYYNGIPISIILLTLPYCDGKCYDCAFLATFGMGNDDFRLVDASVDSIRLQPRYAEEAKSDSTFVKHCFLERTLSNGEVWVYDTSDGLVFRRDLYYLMENPRIRSIRNKQDVVNNADYQSIKREKLGEEKYMLVSMLAELEEMVDSSLFYSDMLAKEIALFKETVGYDVLCKELEHERLIREEEDKEYREFIKRSLELISLR